MTNPSCSLVRMAAISSEHSHTEKGPIFTSICQIIILITPSLSLGGIRSAALWEVFATDDPANSSVVGVFLFGFYEALNSAVIDTVIYVSVDIDRNLTSYYVSLYESCCEPTIAADLCKSAKRMRRKYGHVARTYQHQQLAHKQSDASQNQSRTSRSMEEARDGVARGPCPR